VTGRLARMVQESVHVSTTIDRAAHEVYEYAATPANLSNWAAGLAHQPVQEIGGRWVVESPLGRVVVAFTPPNEYGVLDHDVTLPSGQTVTNPLRVIANGDGCDVVFSVRRQPGMSDAEFAADVDAVNKDLATLRSILER
jgi:Polyketide cyclase / dehydrase and lipid transport